MEEISLETGISPEHISLILETSGKTVSLATPIGDDQTLEDLIDNDRANDPAELAETRSAHANIDKILSSLKQRESLVLRLRYGLGYPEHTLIEAGRRLRVSGERVRQIEMMALYRLKHPRLIKELKR